MIVHAYCTPFLPMEEHSAAVFCSSPTQSWISLFSLAFVFATSGARFSKFLQLFGPEKPFVKLRPAYSVKLVFSYVVKGMKIKITAKFRASRRLRFEDTKRIMSPEMRPKSFGTFEKRTPEFLRFCVFLVFQTEGFPFL